MVRPADWTLPSHTLAAQPPPLRIYQNAGTTKDKTPHPCQGERPKRGKPLPYLYLRALTIIGGGAPSLLIAPYGYVTAHATHFQGKERPPPTATSTQYISQADHVVSACLFHTHSLRAMTGLRSVRFPSPCSSRLDHLCLSPPPSLFPRASTPCHRAIPSKSRNQADPRPVSR